MSDRRSHRRTAEIAEADWAFESPRRRPTPEMLRRAYLHEAGFVVIATLLNGESWVISTGPARGRPMTRTLQEELPWFTTEQEGLNHVIALLAGTEAERVVLGFASRWGSWRAATAISILRDRISAGLEGDLPPAEFELSDRQREAVEARWVECRRAAQRLAAENREVIEYVADVIAVRRVRGAGLSSLLREATRARQ